MLVMYYFSCVLDYKVHTVFTYSVYAVQLLQLWEKNGYFDEVTIQQLQNPALGLGQYQVHLSTETDFYNSTLRSHECYSKMQGMFFFTFYFFILLRLFEKDNVVRGSSLTNAEILAS